MTAEPRVELAEMKMLVKRSVGSVEHSKDPGVRWVLFREEDWRRLQALAGALPPPATG